MILLSFKALSIAVYSLSFPFLISKIAGRFRRLSQVGWIKKIIYWIADQMQLADDRGRRYRLDGDRPRQMSDFWIGAWGILTPCLTFIVIFPWAIEDLTCLLLFPVIFLPLWPLARFIEVIFCLRFGYARLDSDDDGGNQENDQPFEPPPFNGPSRPWPGRRRGQRAAIDRSRSRLRRGERHLKQPRPSVVPGPR